MKQDIVISERIPLKEGGQYLGLITFNSPETMNALDMNIGTKIGEIFMGDFAPDEKVRIIAFTGTGKAFSAGGNLKGYQTVQQPKEEGGTFDTFLNATHTFFNMIEETEKPVIALVNGYCVAGGLELLLACDFGYAAESAMIGDGHANFGMMGGGGDLTRLPRYILPARARELLYTGKFLTAKEALEWGLVNKVVPDEKLIDAGLEFANIIATKSPLGVANMKHVVNTGLKSSFEDSLKLEINTTYHYCTESFDAREGLKAFAEKRTPKYQGR